MNSNKISILTSEFPPQPGGIGNHAYNLAKGLQENGYWVQVLCDVRSKTGIEEKNFDETLSFKVVRIPRKKLLLFGYLNRIKTAFSLIEESDIIIASGKFSLWLGGFLSLFFRRKYVAVIHGSEVKLPNKILRKLTNGSLKRFDEVIAVSGFTKSLVCNLDLKSIHVIHNGFQLDKTNVSEKKQTTLPTLITIGNVTERKGQHNVINALPTLINEYPDLKYHIVGIPTEKEKLEKLALHLGVEKVVVFHGKVSEADKLKLLQQADIFVMLSETTTSGDVEGFGIAILEANSLGIPSIGAKGCGIEDAIRDGYSGKLVNGTQPSEIMLAVEDILNNYNRYAEESEQWASQFTWNIIVKKYIEVLNEGNEN